MITLKDLSWDGISKTIGAIGTAADQISNAAVILGQRKGSTMASETRDTPSNGNGSLLAGLAVIAGIILLKR